MVSTASIRGACAALALAAALVCGCERAQPPPSSAVAPQSNAARASAEPAAPLEPSPQPLGFDAGEVKSAAEYRRDPQFASADLKRGQLLALACVACHTLGAGELTLVGPNLHGMFGRRAAALEGFDYSPGLRASGLVWTPRALEAWLQDPAGFVAGTKMTYTGYRSAEDRRDLIAYLLRATD